MKYAISIDNVRKRYAGTSDPVLNGISLEIPVGKSCAIVGKSGSGKSTLLNIIAGYDMPDQGVIRCFGTDIGRTEDELCQYRRDNLGFVFQSFNLIEELTILDNIIFPMLLQGHKRKKMIEKANKLMASMEIEALANRLPSQISGGQKQRTAICRALIGNPPIILADEPTGNLDSGNAESILKLLLQLVESEQKTLVMVTHDENCAMKMDQIFRMKDGRIYRENGYEK